MLLKSRALIGPQLGPRSDPGPRGAHARVSRGRSVSVSAPESSSRRTSWGGVDGSVLTVRVEPYRAKHGIRSPTAAVNEPGDEPLVVLCWPVLILKSPVACI